MTTTTISAPRLLGTIEVWNGEGITSLDRPVSIQDYGGSFLNTTMLSAGSLPPQGKTTVASAYRESELPQRLVVGAPSNIGDSIWVDHAGVIEDSYEVQYFQGGRTVQWDTDFFTTWEGPEDNSASLLLAQRPWRTYTHPSRVSIVSRGWKGHGKGSLRVLGTQNSNAGQYGADIAGSAAGDVQSLAQMGISTGDSVTVVATCRIGRAQETTTSISRSLIAMTSGSVLYAKDQAPNEPGVYHLRITFTVGNSATDRVLLGGGPTRSEPGVWWDEVGIFKAPYSGGFFSGDDKNYSTVRQEWTGVPNDSTSVQEVAGVAEGAVVFQAGHNLRGASENGQAQIANTLMLRTPDGWVETNAQDETSLELYGRIETQMSTQLTAAGAEPLVTELFRQKALPEVAATFDIVPLEGSIPFVDFNVGDFVSAPGEVPGVLESRRVMSIAFTEDDATGAPQYSIEFDTIFKDRQTELERWISRMSNSSAISGGFTNTNDLPSSVIHLPPGAPIAPVPDAPTGLTVSSLGYYTEDGIGSSDYGLTWNPVISGDGFGTVEVTSYEVWGRKMDQTESQLVSTVFDTAAYLSGYRPGDAWAFKIRAISRQGAPGEFSPEVDLVAAAPQVPLPTPSAPTLASDFGGVTVTWDGLLGGSPAPKYVRYVRVDRAASSSGPWTAVGTLIGHSMQDQPGSPGSTWYYSFVAVDGYGNTSSRSASKSITVKGVSSGDITGGLASNNLVMNGSFEDGLAPFWGKMSGHSSATVSLSTSLSIAGRQYAVMTRGAETSGTEEELVLAQTPEYFIPISELGGKGYFISAKANATANKSNAFTLRAYWYTANKTTLASIEFSEAVSEGNLTTTAQYFVGQVTPPADARYMRIAVSINTVSTTARVDDIVAREVLTENMIGDETLTAVHFSAGSVTASAIQSEAIYSEHISSEAIQAGHIAAFAVQTNHISPSVGSSLDISANASINLIINRADQIEGDLTDTSEELTELKTYYTFGPEGAIIGKTESAFKLSLKNDRIEILENGVVVSYWDSGRMVVRSFVGEEVILGNHQLVKYGTGTVVRRING